MHFWCRKVSGQSQIAVCQILIPLCAMRHEVAFLVACSPGRAGWVQRLTNRLYRCAKSVLQGHWVHESNGNLGQHRHSSGESHSHALCFQRHSTGLHQFCYTLELTPEGEHLQRAKRLRKQVIPWKGSNHWVIFWQVWYFIYFRSSPSIPPRIANISKYILDLFKSRCWKTVEDSDPIRQFSSSPPASWYMAVTSRVCSSGSGHGIGPRLDTIGRGWFDNRRQGFTVHQIMHYQACDLCRSCVSCDTSLSWAAHLKIRHPLSAWGARIESSTWSISVIQTKGRRRKNELNSSKTKGEN